VKVALSANPHKPAALSAAQLLLTRFQGKADVELSDETAAALGGGASGVPVEQLDAEALIGIGGDGTFLALLRRSRLPLLPINAGTVGFLAEIDAGNSEGFEGAVDRLLNHRYFVEDRMKLAARVGNRVLPDATNEVVVHTSQVAKMRLFEVQVDGIPVGRVRADGMILSTPTGSTSYALSALGPIIDPGVQAIVVTALAPFRATQRAMLIDPWRTVTVRLVLPEKDGVVVIDGQHEERVAAGATVSVCRSSRPASFIRFGSPFYRRLQGRGLLPFADDALDDPAG
jgi:NAD+ kinase